MAKEPYDPYLFALYGVRRNTRSHHGRYFRLSAIVHLVEMPDHQGDFYAVFIEPPQPRLSLWQRLRSGPFWFRSGEQPLLVAVLSTGEDDRTTVPYKAVRAWLQAHCGWNF